jgi:hypothetical protein
MAKASWLFTGWEFWYKGIYKERTFDRRKAILKGKSQLIDEVRAVLVSKPVGQQASYKSKPIKIEEI